VTCPDVGNAGLVVQEHPSQGVRRTGLVRRLDHQGQGDFTLGSLIHGPECIASPAPLLRSFLTIPGGRQTPSSQFKKRVSDGESFDPLPVLQVLAVEQSAACVEGGCDDQRIVEAVAVARLEIERATVQ
jgi:hypothetical protein